MVVQFETYGVDGATANSASVDNGKRVEWDALNNYIVETCGLQDGDTLVGYISALYDLGVQTPADSEYVFTGTQEDEAAEIAKNPSVYFKDGLDDNKAPARLKCAPSKPFQHVTFAVDFPEIMLDKGKFFGDDGGAKPLRLYLGGDFWMGKEIGKVVQNPFSMKNTTKTGVWSFDSKATIYKMAVGAKLIKDGEPFESKRIGELLGKSLQWKVKIDLSESKGKFYLNQKIGYAAGLGRGQQSIEPVMELVYVGFNKDNDAQAVNEIPSHIVNTMKRASNFEGSKLQQQLVGDGASTAQADVEPEELPPSVPQYIANDLDEKLPF